MLRGERAFKVCGRQVAQGLMNPAPVIEQQVFGNRVCRLCAGFEMLSVDTFHLERLKERFGASVIVGRTRAAHALNGADGRGLAPEVPRCILTAAIRMDHQPFLRAPVRHGVLKGGDRQISIQRFAYCPADHAAAEQVDKCAQVQPALVRRHVGEIRYPCLIRHTDPEILPEQVRKRWSGTGFADNQEGWLTCYAANARSKSAGDR